MFVLAVMNGLVTGVIYALCAWGQSGSRYDDVVTSPRRVLHPGRIFSYLFSTAFGLNILLSVTLSIALVFIFGLIVEYTLIRPTYGDDMYSLILTFILSIVLQNAYLLIFGPYPNKPPGWVSGATSVLGMFYYGNQRMAALIAGICIIALLFILIKMTWFGRIIRAASQDREMAELNGVNTARLNMLSFGLGCGLAAAAGVILSPVFPVTPTSGVPLALTAFVVVVLGGMGSMRARCWGVLFWDWWRTLVPHIFPQDTSIFSDSSF